ncbi:PTS 2-O-a-mannosyl-D-glycerate transporter subunit IIABC [Jeotgalibaca sp. MA1X17-3]|uniref:PTS 2-O-a-mannosyl-D-glycerate transporter subunit IIABC n=1 Tax=Jeotgalibaca sp. MA1X17-3 TaxID=2908211 RepID=UPI001F482D0B|nr:PTS 2-O-a-mannosyl-D-glycerate transporter subunit IIABC [Jeotgalibaca sp. MA1X17-3]UJF14899.1 PTS 2-O-a-mannosyl-D-glycerate transporter subunit IIABC [Jeotgalibaca sp. MA1X17-3]
MDLKKITSPELIHLDVDVNSKEEVLELMVQSLYENGKIHSDKEFMKAIYEREALSATGFENGLAIPHGKSKTVKEASVAVFRLKNELTDYESLDPNNKVKLLFMLAIPEEEAGSTHLTLLAELATRLSDENYFNQFLTASTSNEVYELLGEQEKEEKEVIQDAEVYLGVTACPAGIAHTYMAAEALQKAAKAAGVNIFVEKQGANGIEDKHTAKQLREAKGIIFAVDVIVKDPERYAHLPSIKTNVADPLRNASTLMEQIIEKGKSYDGQVVNNDFEEVEETKLSFKNEVKNSVLTGISYIIPIIIAGGMLLTFATLVTQGFGLQELYNTPGSWLNMYRQLSGGLLGTLMVPILAGYMSYSIADKPGLTPGLAAGFAANMIGSGFLGGMLGGLVAGYIMKYMKIYIKPKGVFAGFVSFWVYPVLGTLLVGTIMLFVLGTPVTWLNEQLVSWLDTLQGGSALALGAVLGIMVSFDLGGPVNKAAYAFCIAAMASGNYVPYAAFASVKMVSAFAITGAVVFGKDLYTEQEKEIGQQTWLLGLAGITEGAIPFMMNDLIRVIASLSVGSAITGAIVTTAGVGLSVPGAGIFSLFLLENVSSLMGIGVWLGSALLGAAISTVLLILTRKNKLSKLSEVK